jgi:hypothetical protein
MYHRVKRYRISHQEALDWYWANGVKPHRQYQTIRWDGLRVSITEAGKRLGITPRMIRNRSEQHHGGSRQATVDWYRRHRKHARGRPVIFPCSSI